MQLVPALMCSTPISNNGVITATWSYIHTGGLPLTDVSVFYTFLEGGRDSDPTKVPVSGVDVTSVMVPNLVAGFEYTLTVTASNSNGSSSVQCGPVFHEVG